jgi:hypothetical protein
MSDYTRLPHDIADCMSRAGSPLSDDQKLLSAGYLAPVQQQLEQAQDESVQAVANKVCGELPEGWVINLCMENGAAWVEAIKPSGYTIDIDRGDLSLAEQVGEALRLADEAERAGGDK